MAIIYKITNKVNGKIYIGFTTKTLEERWKWHVSCSISPKYIFHKSIKKYGSDSFYREILSESDNEEFLLKVMEPQYIAMYQSNNRDYGYNMTSGGEGIIGFRHSDISRAKMSESKSGKPRSPETIQKMSMSSKGRISPMKGKFHTAETKNKFKEAWKRRKGII